MTLHLWPLTWRDAGSRPTADISDVLPPTQSNIGNLANQPSILAVLSNKEFSCVIATPCIIARISDCDNFHKLKLTVDVQVMQDQYHMDFLNSQNRKWIDQSRNFPVNIASNYKLILKTIIILLSINKVVFHNSKKK